MLLKAPGPWRTSIQLTPALGWPSSGQQAVGRSSSVKPTAAAAFTAAAQGAAIQPEPWPETIARAWPAADSNAAATAAMTRAEEAAVSVEGLTVVETGLGETF